MVLPGSPMLEKILSCGEEMRVHCPSPMTNGTHQPYDFQDIPDSTFAQQLTCMDTVSALLLYQLLVRPLHKYVNLASVHMFSLIITILFIAHFCRCCSRESLPISVWDPFGHNGTEVVGMHLLQLQPQWNSSMPWASESSLLSWLTLNLNLRSVLDLSWSGLILLRWVNVMIALLCKDTICWYDHGNGFFCHLCHLPFFLLQELRMHKNFSSLKAIISGLQSNPIYRLKKTWGAVIKDKVSILML